MLTDDDLSALLNGTPKVPSSASKGGAPAAVLPSLPDQEAVATSTGVLEVVPGETTYLCGMGLVCGACGGCLVRSIFGFAAVCLRPWCRYNGVYYYLGRV